MLLSCIQEPRGSGSRFSGKQKLDAYASFKLSYAAGTRLTCSARLPPLGLSGATPSRGVKHNLHSIYCAPSEQTSRSVLRHLLACRGANRDALWPRMFGSPVAVRGGRPPRRGDAHRLGHARRRPRRSPRETRDSRSGACGVDGRSARQTIIGLEGGGLRPRIRPHAEDPRRSAA